MAPVPIKCTLHKVMVEMYRGNYTFTKKRKKKKKKKSRCYFTSVFHSIHTKCFQIVQKYQRHYERFFGDETKVQKSQGNRANERKQSSSCLCFLKDNQTSMLRRALGFSKQEARGEEPAFTPRMMSPSLGEIHLSAHHQDKPMSHL